MMNIWCLTAFDMHRLLAVCASVPAYYRTIKNEVALEENLD